VGISRRVFLISGATLGGALAIAAGGVGTYVGLHNRLSHQRAANSEGDGDLVNLWIRIAPDDTVTVLMPHTDMGQGSQTALAQIVADELDARWDQIRIELAPPDTAYANGKPVEGFVNEMRPIPGWADAFAEKAFFRIADFMNMQMTGGSTAVRYTGWDNMRQAAAVARDMLMRAGAEKLGTGIETLQCAQGVVSDVSGERSLTFGELSGTAALLTPQKVAPKNPDAYTLVGSSVPREDIPRKVFAEESYGIDVEVPEMQYAAVRHASVFGASVTQINNGDEIRTRRGVADVVQLEDAVAVVADNPWRAEQAVRSLDFDVQQHANQQISSASLEQAQRDALASNLDMGMQQGDIDAAFTRASSTVEAEYFVPYLAHAAMEPLNATLWQQDGKLHVACGVQNPLMARAHAAEIADLQLEDVVLHARPMGGGFGRRVGFTMTGDIPLNWLTDAVQIALTQQRPIKMMWSREEDMHHDVYRPMVLAQFKAGLDDAGNPIAWHSKSFLKEADVRAVQPVYEIENKKVDFAGGHQAVPTGFWRSVEHSQHGFFKECFIDELAQATGKDPLQFRLSLLADDSSEARTLRKVAEMANWQVGVDGDGRALGCAVVHSFGSTVAQIAQVSRESTGVRVHRVWCAVDSGRVINPQAAKAQIEGAVHFALSAVLYGKCDIAGGGVVQSNYHDYRMVTLRDAPRVSVELLSSDNPIGGFGEIGVPPLAPAVCNAMAVIEDRTRRLPLMA
jgi:isoquinoline 1-oxidoreductase beta subunit